MFFQISSFQQIISQSQELVKEYLPQKKYSLAINFQENDFSALLFAILYILPPNDTFKQTLIQYSSNKSGQKFKEYLLKSIQIDKDVYNEGGIILCLYLKEKLKEKFVSKLNKEILSFLANKTNLNFEIRVDQQKYCFQLHQQIGQIKLLKINNNWYMPIDKQEEDKLATLNQSISCLICSKNQKVLFKSKCNHNYCEECLKNIFANNQKLKCESASCEQIIQYSDFSIRKTCTLCQNFENLLKNQCGHEYCFACIEKLKSQHMVSCKICKELIQFQNPSDSRKIQTSCFQCSKIGYLEEFFENSLCKKQHQYCLNCSNNHFKSISTKCIDAKCSEQLNRNQLEKYLQNQIKKNNLNAGNQKQVNYQYQCQICNVKYNDQINLYKNYCGHYYCQKCIRQQVDLKFIDNAQCPKCRQQATYSLVKVSTKMQQKQNFFCHACNENFENKNTLFMNEECGHYICINCIQLKGLEQSKCYIAQCQFLINQSLLIEFQNNIIAQNKQNLITKISRKCFKCQQVNEIVSEKEYYQCKFCKEHVCIKHDQLLKECQCKCQHCYGELLQFEKYFKQCQNCKHSVCVFCKDKVIVIKTHMCKQMENTLFYYDQKIINEQRSQNDKYSDTYLQEKNNKGIQKDDFKVLEQQNQQKNENENNLKKVEKKLLELQSEKQLNEEKKNQNKNEFQQLNRNDQNNQEQINQNQQACGGCDTMFNEFITPLKVQNCKIHKQCMLCKFSISSCIICPTNRIYSQQLMDGNIIQQVLFQLDRILLIQEVDPRYNNVNYQLQVNDPRPSYANSQKQNFSKQQNYGQNFKNMQEPLKYQMPANTFKSPNKVPPVLDRRYQ